MISVLRCPPKNNWKVKNIRAMNMTVKARKKKSERAATAATEARSVF